jgi:predicted ATPase/class 3 adenylate cyclase/DNA-binding CsgD family transcriptional regulator
MTQLPSGTVTFLFTDLEGSTRLWEQYPDAMKDALARHDDILRDVIESHHGCVVKTTGDGAHAAFMTATDAVLAAVRAQEQVAAESWPVPETLAVRMGLHSGHAEIRAGDYFGSAVNRGARVAAAAHGGQIVLSRATEELVRDALPAEVALVDLGEHRLRDLSRPERVFQVVAAGLRREFAPLRTLDALPGNLPLQLSSFVGRDAELARVTSALEQARIVTLAGVGGVGKTRLALQVAADVMPRYRDGAWFCELAAVRDPDGVVEAVAGAFGVSEHPGLTLQDSLRAYLRDQQLLLILDNCEHVLRAAARLVVAIETSCADVRVLATSREGLNVAGEHLLTVPSLSVPDRDDGADAADECESVRLFVERAQAVKDDFILDRTNRADVIEICTRLDGVPLAIELAAARIPAMKPSELAQRLDRRFRLLGGGSRVALERHQTLRATIDWSYDLLTEAEQRLLGRLSVFAGSCTLDAAEAVCAGAPVDADDVLELLVHLVAHHLIDADDTGTETRYRLLETIRQYSEERLAKTDDPDVLRARHCDYYTAFAAANHHHIFGPGLAAWGARLARERDNVLAALAFALDSHDAARAIRLVAQLPYPYMQANDLVVIDAEAVLALPGATDYPESAVALMIASFNAARRGDLAGAAVLCDQSLEVDQRLGPVADAYLGIAQYGVRAPIALSAGATPEEVAALYLVGAQQARDAGLPAWSAYHVAYAATHLVLEQPQAAAAYATEGLQLARQSGAPLAVSMNLLALAQALTNDDPPRAHALLEEAVELALTVGYESPNELAFVANTAARLGDWPTVLRAITRVLHHQLRSGSLTLQITMMLPMAARGLAEHSPEASAVIQGGARALTTRLRPHTSTTGAPAAPAAGTVTATVRRERVDTARLLVERLGEQRLHELRTVGEAMEPDELYSYARAHINTYLATIDESMMRETARATPIDDLTERENDILSLVAAGSTNQQIAGQLHVSIKTVERHLTNLYRKLQVANRTEAAGYTVRRSRGD